MLNNSLLSLVVNETKTVEFSNGIIVISLHLKYLMQKNTIITLLFIFNFLILKILLLKIPNFYVLMIYFLFQLNQLIIKIINVYIL
jgi:hypothetical protein